MHSEWSESYTLYVWTLLTNGRQAANQGCSILDKRQQADMTEATQRMATLASM